MRKVLHIKKPKQKFTNAPHSYSNFLRYPSSLKRVLRTPREHKIPFQMCPAKREKVNRPSSRALCRLPHSSLLRKPGMKVPGGMWRRIPKLGSRWSIPRRDWQVQKVSSRCERSVKIDGCDSWQLFCGYWKRINSPLVRSNP